MSVIHAPRGPEFDTRHVVFPIALALAFLVLLVRLWYLQVVLSAQLTEKALYSQRTSVSQLAPRGLIVDRSEVEVAGLEPRVVITARPGVVLQNAWVLEKLASMLGVETGRLLDKAREGAWRPYLPTPIHVGATIEVATRVAESGQHLPGIEVTTMPMRVYPDTEAFTHVLGYVWTPNGNDVKRLTEQGLKAASYVGKIGIERIYEKQLMGTPGTEEFEFNAKRRPARSVGRNSPVPGDRLILGIDSELQREAFRLLKGYRGAIVAIDPRNGEVLCLASAPTYDSKPFEGGISTKDWKALNEDPDKPLINRAIASSYAPGSTFKIVTTLAAMRAGIFDPNRTFLCKGYYAVGNRKSKCLGHHGAIAFHRAFEKSCNSYFSDLGMRAGKDMLRDTAIECGLGKRAGIDLVGESTGIVPTDEWLARWRSPVRWYSGDTVNLSIGQGELSTTPLQMAQLAALVANRGIGYRPHIARAFRAPSADEAEQPIVPEISHRLDVSGSNWDQLLRAMTSVIETGTASVARIPGIAWGGKTGSAERRGQSMTDSWFVGFAPADNPRIAICVSVEGVGHGSDFAAPFARDVVRSYLLRKPTATVVSPAAEVSASAASADRPRAR